MDVPNGCLISVNILCKEVIIFSISRRGGMSMISTITKKSKLDKKLTISRVCLTTGSPT